MHDVIIIGSGVAGIAAAKHLGENLVNALVVTKDAAPETSNGKFATIETKPNTEVTGLDKNITSLAIETKRGDIFYGKSVIIATGKERTLPSLAGIDTLVGKKIFLHPPTSLLPYQGKDIAVFGSGNSAMESLLLLTKAARRLYSINPFNDFAGDRILRQRAQGIPGVAYLTDSRIISFDGKIIESIRPGGAAEQIIAHFLFLETDSHPAASFDLLTQKNLAGEIKVDKHFATSATGAFAAGDVCDTWSDDPAIAALQGIMAARGAIGYLSGAGPKP